MSSRSLDWRDSASGLVELPLIPTGHSFVQLETTLRCVLQMELGRELAIQLPERLTVM